MTMAIPETMAEKRKTTGIITLLHQGFALMEPKIKPTYPWSRKADGIPIIVTTLTVFLSNATAFSLISLEKRERHLSIHFLSPVASPDQTIISRRYSNHISSKSTTIRYQRYTKPNMAMAEVGLGVRNIS